MNWNILFIGIWQWLSPFDSWLHIFICCVAFEKDMGCSIILGDLNFDLGNLALMAWIGVPSDSWCIYLNATLSIMIMLWQIY